MAVVRGINALSVVGYNSGHFPSDKVCWHFLAAFPELLICTTILWASLMAQDAKNLPAMWDTWVLSWAKDLLRRAWQTPPQDSCLETAYMDRKAWWLSSPWGHKDIGYDYWAAKQDNTAHNHFMTLSGYPKLFPRGLSCQNTFWKRMPITVAFGWIYQSILVIVVSAVSLKYLYLMGTN